MFKIQSFGGFEPETYGAVGEAVKAAKRTFSKGTWFRIVLFEGDIPKYTVAYVNGRNWQVKGEVVPYKELS